jgi:diguanylate cyclase (GGDEF)-like protein
MNDHTTLALDKAEVSLLQALDGTRLPCLILYSGPEAGTRFDLRPGRWILGRGQGADLVVDSPGISRRHAAVVVGADGVDLHDLGSANATHVNDARLTAPVRLHDGDWVRVADRMLRFHGCRSVDAVLHDRLYRLATVDPGTGVANRRHAAQALRQEVERARRTGAPLALLCIDLDRFKAVNDTHGHAAGDRVLRHAATVLGGSLRPDDLIGRWGGEEFIVLARDTRPADAATLAERLRQALQAQAFEIESPGAACTRRVLHVQTASIGVAMFCPAMRDEHDLMALADRRLYAAKRAGRNRVVADDGAG